MSKWTKEQENAIEKRGCDILVSAAAGSGKTAVLVERIIKIITDKDEPVDIDRLLVLTFTNAAAREMKERISTSLSKLLRENPKDINIKNQLTLLNKAQITTIHAFCMDVVRKNYALINIDPAFRIADDAETEIVKNEVLDSLFEEKYAAGDEEFLSLIESFDTGLKDSGLRRNLLEVYKFIKSNPFPDKWIYEACERYNLCDCLENSFLGALIAEEIRFKNEAAKINGIAALSVTKKPYGPVEYADAITDDLEFIEKLEKGIELNFATVINLIDNHKFKTLARKKKETDDTLAQEAKLLREALKDEIKEIRKKILIKSTEQMEEDISKTYPFLKYLGELVLEFDKRFDEAKRRKNIMDFNDLEHYCVKVLVKENDDGTIEISDCAKSYRERFYEILTDEYQDSNTVQELILSAVSKGGNRFMVGDVKQSIYKFRMAKPEIFMEKYESFKKDGSQVRIDLFKNFRSRKNILDGINFLFERLMSKSFGDIEYDEAAALSAGGSFEEVSDDSISVDILEKSGIEAFAEENGEDFALSEVEARHIAKRIKKLMNEDFGVTEKSTGKLRKIKYSDIAILMRASKAATEVYTEVFEREGIPLKTDMSSGFFNTTEIMTVTNILNVIDNPRQDIPLVSVLYSPIYNLDANDLMEIKLMGKKDFYSCLKEYLENGKNEDIKNTVSLFFDDLKAFRNEVGHITIADLITKIYNDTGYFDMAGAMEDGKTKQANLHLLIKKAENYEKSNFHGLFNFIKYIERVALTSSEVGEARLDAGEAESVSFMTIHKSKGLEYPVVFVAGLGKKFNKSDGQKSVLMSPSLGFGLKRFDYKNRVIYETASRRVIGENIVRESLSEELRVLYVALTRARDKLFLVGTVDDFGKRMASWATYMFFEKLPYSRLLKENCFLDWIVPCLLRHRDGNKLRHIADIEDYCLGCDIVEDESRWDISVINSLENEKAEEKEEKTEAFEADSDEVKRIKESLSAKYAYNGAVSLPANVSISELKRLYQNRFEEEENESIQFKEASGFEYADFKADTSKPSSARKGTVMHSVMENISFKNAVGKADVKDVLDGLVFKNVITGDEADSVNVYKVLNFFKNPFYERIKNAKAVYKEEPFAMTLKSEEVFPDKNVFGEDILLHGIIDCYFEEEDGLVVLDYKTDFVTSEEEIKNRYALQMKMYAIALEKATGKRVKGVYIYLFGTDKILDMGC